jgi:hypothetical protein
MITVSIFIHKKEQLSHFLTIRQLVGDEGEKATGVTETGLKYIKEMKFEFFNSVKIADQMMNSVDVMQINVPLGLYMALELVTAKDF